MLYGDIEGSNITLKVETETNLHGSISTDKMGHVVSMGPGGGKSGAGLIFIKICFKSTVLLIIII